MTEEWSEQLTIDETARRRFESAWRAGDPIAIETALPDRTDPTWLATLEELVHIDIEFRWRHCDSNNGKSPPQIEDYIDRHGELKEDAILARLIEQEFRVRHRFGDRPDVESYCSRFPQAKTIEDKLTKIASAATRSSRQAQESGTVRVGEDVDGYRVDNEFARGGFGRVFAATDKTLGRTVALKQLSPQIARDAETRSRFLTEARIAAELEHPGVVPVYALHEEPGKEPYYTMKLVRGQTLAEAIKALHACPANGNADNAAEKQIERSRLLQAYLNVARTMAFAHDKGVIHRDLKPANIILGDYGETVILDWGLAKKLEEADVEATTSDESPMVVDVSDFASSGELRHQDADATTVQMTQPGAVMGTPVYMPPEQASGRVQEVGVRADVYALGAILYELLTGTRPFHGKSSAEVIKKVLAADLPPPRAVNGSIARPLDAICRKAMAKNAPDRYASAGRLADDLERFLADQPVSVYRESTLERAMRWTRRHRTFAMTATAALLLLTAGSIVAALLINDQKDKAVQARADAEIAEAEAIESERKTKIALEQAEQALYVARIGAAHREWTDSYLDKTTRLLNETPASRRGWEWHYLNRISNDALLTLALENDSICCAAYSADGKQIATGSEAGRITIWNAEDGKIAKAFGVADEAINTILFDRAGTSIYTLSDRTLRAFDAATNQQRWANESASAFSAIAVTPDDQFVVLINKDQKLLMIRAADGEVVNESPGPLPAPVHAIDYHAGSKQMAIGFHFFVGVELHDLTGRKKPINHLGGERDPYDVRFNESGDRLIVAYGDANESSGSVAVFDCADLRQLHNMEGPVDIVRRAVPFADGRLVAMAGHDRRVLIGGITTGDLLRTIRTPGGVVYDLSVDSKTRRAVTVTEDGIARVWDIHVDPSGNLSNPDGGYIEFRKPYADLRGAAFSNDATWFVDGYGFVRSTATGKIIDQLVPYGANSASGVAVSPDGNTFALGDSRGGVGIWQMDGERIQSRFIAHHERAAFIRFSADGKQLLTASDIATSSIGDEKIDALDELDEIAENSGEISAGENEADAEPEGEISEDGVKLWTLTPHKLERTFAVGELIGQIAFAPDGKHIAVICNRDRGDGKDSRYELVFYEIESGDEVTWDSGDHQPHSFAFSRNGRWMATGDRYDGRVVIWNLQTKAMIAELRGHADRVSAIAFFPDGARLATTGYDKSLKVWNTTNWRETLSLDTGGEMDTLIVSADSNTIVGIDQYASRGRIWNAQPPDHVTRTWPQPFNPQDALPHRTHRPPSIIIDPPGSSLPDGLPAAPPEIDLPDGTVAPQGGVPGPPSSGDIPPPPVDPDDIPGFEDIIGSEDGPGVNEQDEREPTKRRDSSHNESQNTNQNTQK